MSNGGPSDLAALAGQLAGVLVQYGLPALLVLVLLYVERLAKSAAREKKLPNSVGTTLVVVSWALVFGLIVLVAWQMIDDRTRRAWVTSGEILGIDPPLRLELYDSEAYLRDTPATDHAPRRHEFVLVTSTPLRERCLQLRILTPDRLPVVRPDGTPLSGFALPVSSDDSSGFRATSVRPENCNAAEASIQRELGTTRAQAATALSRVVEKDRDSLKAQMKAKRGVREVKFEWIGGEP